jgi:uncharacterized protein YoxC
MKTIRTLAAVLLAAFLVLGPAVAFGATLAMTLQTNAPSYAGQSTITVSGTVTPAPTIPNTAVVITTTGPNGVVDTGEAAVATSTGAFTYTLVSGGSAGWTSGTFTVNGTWGGQGNTATKTTTFLYTAGQGGGGGGGNPTTAVNVQVTASTPTLAGQQEYVGILTSFAQNGSLAGVTFQTIHYHTPQGTLVTLCSSAPPAAGCTGTFATIHVGFYQINFTAPATAGGYFIHAWTNGPKSAGVSSGQGQGLGQFTVQAASNVNPDAAALASIQSALTTLTTTVNGIQSSISVLTAGFGTINSGLQTLTTNVNGIPSSISTLQSAVNTISTGVTGITATLSGLSNSLNTLNGIGTQLTSLNNAVNNNQTYVLVVAALAAITLVLELAILVRKLS